MHWRQARPSLSADYSVYAAQLRRRPPVNGHTTYNLGSALLWFVGGHSKYYCLTLTPISRFGLVRRPIDRRPHEERGGGNAGWPRMSTQHSRQGPARTCDHGRLARSLALPPGAVLFGEAQNSDLLNVFRRLRDLQPRVSRRCLRCATASAPPRRVSSPHSKWCPSLH